MKEKDLKNLVSHITGYEVKRVERVNENCAKVFVKGSVYPHDRFNVSNSVPITLSVVLEEEW